MRKWLFIVAVISGIIFSKDVFAATKYYTINGHHGKLAAMLQTPDKENYPVVILMHGFNARKEMPLLQIIADKLEEKGIATFRFDFNGHGLSEGKFEDMTILNEVADAEKVYDFVLNIPNITSVSLAGHSQGGVVAAELAGKLGAEKIKSLVLLAPASVLHDMAKNGDLFGVKYDTDNLPIYVDIPGCCHVGREYVETAKNMQIYDTAKRYSGPVLIVHGLKDTLVPIEYGKQYDSIYENSKLEELFNAGHLYIGYENLVGKDVADFIFEKTK